MSSISLPVRPNAVIRCREPARSWRASLDIQFVRRQARTLLGEARHNGPLRIQKPFYPEGDEVCHVVVLHPPGGLVAGDALSIRAKARPGAHGLVTTPSAGRVYRTDSSGCPQIQSVDIQVDDADFEWLPQENIIFSGAAAENRPTFRLSGASRLIGWDITCLGRPAGNFPFEEGFLKQSLDIVIDGKPAYIERGRYDGGSPLLKSRWGLKGFTTFGTFFCTLASDDVLGRIREACHRETGDYLLGFTRVRQLLIGRYLGHSAQQARKLFSLVWSIVRPELMGKTTVEPRIWNT